MSLVLYFRSQADNGTLGYNDVISKHGIRPVLNLKCDSLKYGDGTMNNPYRLTETIDSTTSSGSGSGANRGASGGVVGTDSPDDITVIPGTGGSDGPQIQ